MACKASATATVPAFADGGKQSRASAALQIVSDKLISVFASKNLKEWRKLIAHSSQWPTLAPNVFAR